MYYKFLSGKSTFFYHKSMQKPFFSLACGGLFVNIGIKCQCNYRLYVSLPLICAEGAEKMPKYLDIIMYKCYWKSNTPRTRAKKKSFLAIIFCECSRPNCMDSSSLSQIRSMLYSLKSLKKNQNFPDTNYPTQDLIFTKLILSKYHILLRVFLFQACV